MPDVNINGHDAPSPCPAAPYNNTPAQCEATCEATCKATRASQEAALRRVASVQRLQQLNEGPVHKLRPVQSDSRLRYQEQRGRRSAVDERTLAPSTLRDVYCSTLRP